MAAGRMHRLLVAIGVAVALGSCVAAQAYSSARDRSLDGRLAQRLQELGFTGRIESTLTTRLGRPLDPRLANIGRLLWFDTITGLNDDNTCAGCHSPTNGFGDTQPIAIGIDNNGIVGPDRTGPRNMRRAPMVINTRVLPEPDVELALLVAVRRPVRQQRRLPVPAAGGHVAVVPAASARRAGVHPADRAHRGRRVSTSPATTTPSAPR